MPTQVTELSTHWVTLDVYDKDGNPATPSELKYRIDDLDTGEQILDDTAVVSPTESNDVKLTPANNTLLDSNNLSELRRLTAKAVFSATEHTYIEVDIEVVRVRFPIS